MSSKIHSSQQLRFSSDTGSGSEISSNPIIQKSMSEIINLKYSPCCQSKRNLELEFARLLNLTFPGPKIITLEPMIFKADIP